MVEHISCRVPWHDNGWNGCICNNPYNNTSCLRCKAIFEEINKELENSNASKMFNELGCETNNFPCIREGAAFLCDKEIEVTIKYPYSTYGGKYDKLFANLLPVEEVLPPYSYPAVP